MAVLTWDKTGDKIYETGNKKMVLYVMGKSGAYQKGVAWNGITAVSSNDSGAEETALWADDIKYAVLRSAPEYGGTIEAYQCPDEFYICDGQVMPVKGVIIGQQSRRSFGISYVTTIGNDVNGTDHGYKIHLVYGCSASPSERSYQTINDSPDAITNSWEFTTTPVTVSGHPDLKPVSHITIDSTKADPEVLKEIEEYLYGSEHNDPTLPSPSEILRIFTDRPYGYLDETIYLL